MTMDPSSFRDLLDRATELPPPARTGSDPLALGRRRLRRHRLAASAGAALAVVAVAGVAGVGTHGLPGGRHQGLDHTAALPSAPRDAPTTDTDLLGSCAHGNQGAEATGLVFGSGTPTVESVVRTTHQVIVALQSADGRYWGDCFVHLDSAEFGSGMTVYPNQAADRTASRSTSYSYGPGCGLVGGKVDTTCTLWSVDTADRLPDAVAAVRYALGDGTTQTVQAHDGYVVLNHLGTLPGGATVGPNGDFPADFAPLTRITYLDAAGTPIASDAEDGSGTGEGGSRVHGLPALSAYPSLRGDEVS